MAPRRKERKNVLLHQSGLSLVELMVALVIGLIVLGGVVHMFMHSRQTYAELSNVSRLQENVGFITDHLRVELRNANDISWNNDTLSITRARASACDGNSSTDVNEYQIGGGNSNALLCNSESMIGGDNDFEVTNLNVECLSTSGTTDCTNNSLIGAFVTLSITSSGVTHDIPITVALRNKILPLIIDPDDNEELTEE